MDEHRKSELRGLCDLYLRIDGHLESIPESQRGTMEFAKGLGRDRKIVLGQIGERLDPESGVFYRGNAFRREGESVMVVDFPSMVSLD